MMALKAKDRQPTNFDGLQTTAMVVEGVILHRTFQCACGNDHLNILAGKWPDQKTWLDPVQFTCQGCGASKEIFNSQTDGYDGKLCGGAACLQNPDYELVECPECNGRDLRLKASIFYNIDYDDPRELAELDDDFKAVLGDLYDALGLSGVCKECENEFPIGDWELA